MRSSTKDILAALFGLAIAAAFQAQTGELEGISLYFPEMLLIFISLCSAGLLLNGLLKLRREQAEEDREPVAWGRVIQISIGSIAYVGVIPLLGFYPASAIFLFGMAWMLRDRDGGTRKAVIAASLLTLILCFAVWGGFSLLLSVPTPESVLFE